MKIGFIGAGNMAKAIIGGIVKKLDEGGTLGGEKPGRKDITASSPVEAERQFVEKEFGINAVSDNKELCRMSDIIVFAVKPQVIGIVADEVKDEVDGKLLISIVAGKSIGWYEENFGKKLKLVRIMPNTPALVGEGMTGVCKAEGVSADDMDIAMDILSSFGKAEEVPENLMDAVCAVSGSSPAYVFMMIEAMADAAVKLGMPRPKAYTFAAQAVYGSAKMVLETGKHPGELKDMVCSPAGTTIEAVRVLENMGFRSSLIEAMDACAEVSKSL